MVEPAKLHNCAMHSGAQHATAAQSAPTTSADSHSHHAPAPDESSRHCTCLGDCSAGKSSHAIAARPATLSADVTDAYHVAFADYNSPVLIPAEFILPPAQAPPTKALART